MEQQDLQLAIANVLALEDLKPCLKTNSAFTTLVEVILSHKELHNISYQVVQQVRSLAGLAEFELEKYWAKRIITSENPMETLRSFPYFGNYVKLVQLELEQILETGFPSTELAAGVRILFIGSGPLSMTSLLLNHFIGAHVDNVDISERAIELSTGVAESLGVASGFIEGDGATISTSSSTGSYNLIIIAALAGISQTQKQQIIENVLPALHQNGRLVLRSAIGARLLLYPHVETGGLRGVKVLKEFHPQDEVINSVIICSKK